MQKLLEQMEQAGYRNRLGFPLVGNSDWSELKAKIAEVQAYAIEADKAMKLLMERVQDA